MEQIQLTATLPNIGPGDLAEFKRLAAQALDLAKDEAGTLQYDWFISSDETKCVVRERYENSDAILSHMANLGELIGKLAGLGGGLEIEAFGTLSFSSPRQLLRCTPASTGSSRASSRRS